MNTIIEKIRAEVERRKKELEKDKTIHPANQAGRIKELDLILSRLSDLEKEEKPTPADWLEIEAVSYCFDNGLNLSPRVATDIARHFTELVAEKFAKIIRANLTQIDESVQSQFEHLYMEITKSKMYGGYND